MEPPERDLLGVLGQKCGLRNVRQQPARRVHVEGAQVDGIDTAQSEGFTREWFENVYRNSWGIDKSQIIEFDNIELIDSSSQIYIIPVKQKNLRELQEIEEIPVLEMEAVDIPKTKQSVYKPLSRSYLYYYGYNTFNNILVYNAKSEIIQPIFSYRIAIIE